MTFASGERCIHCDFDLFVHCLDGRCAINLDQIRFQDVKALQYRDNNSGSTNLDDLVLVSVVVNDGHAGLDKGS